MQMRMTTLMTKKVPYLTDEQSSAMLRRCWPNMRRLAASSSSRQIPIEDIVEKHLKLGIEFDDTHRLFGVPRPRSRSRHPRRDLFRGSAA